MAGIKDRLMNFGAQLVLERPVKGLGLAEMAQRLEKAGRQYEQELASSSGTAESCTALSHVIGIERWGQRRLRVALGDPPIQDEYDAYRPPRERAWQDLVADFKATRQETLTLVHEIDRCNLPEGWKIRHNMFGDLSVRGWLRYLEMHSDPRGGHRIR